jgi:signal transduction histidine kinase
MVPRDLIAGTKNQKYYESLREDEWSGHLLIEETFRTKSGESFPVELSLDQFELDGQTYICGFARNISARVKAEHELIERNKELNYLYSLAQHIANRDNSIIDILEFTIEKAFLAWLHPEVTVARISFLGKEYHSKNFKMPVSSLEEAIFSGESEVGLIEVGYSETMPEKVQGPFLKEEVSLLNGIAKQLSRMLDSRDAERRIISSILTTEDQERSRISKELHDSVGQTLSAISLNLDSICRSNTLNDAERVKLKSIDALLRDAISESRSVSHNLMPPALTDLGYSNAVENLLGSLEGVGETEFSFHSNEAKREIKKEIEYTLFRITQEAVNNIIKYAEAKEVVIQYLIYEEAISLSIEDDGIGFDMNIVDKKHNFGLNSMRNRAASINGELTIDTSPGKGTGIHLNIPLT